jgi:hypothetical protein
MRYEPVAGHLDKRALRLFAAARRVLPGVAALATVSLVTGIARSTIGRGLKDLDKAAAQCPAQAAAAARRRLSRPALRKALLQLITSAIRGDPQAALLWVSRSQRHLATALVEQGYRVSPDLVGRLLKDLGFSLQANAKTREGRQHPDPRCTVPTHQHINDVIEWFRRRRQPAISVETKRRSWSAISRTLVANCDARASRRKRACTAHCSRPPLRSRCWYVVQEHLVVRARPCAPAANQALQLTLLTS